MNCEPQSSTMDTLTIHPVVQEHASYLVTVRSAPDRELDAGP